MEKKVDVAFFQEIKQRTATQDFIISLWWVVCFEYQEVAANGSAGGVSLHLEPKDFSFDGNCW